MAVQKEQDTLVTQRNPQLATLPSAKHFFPHHYASPATNHQNISASKLYNTTLPSTIVCHLGCHFGVKLQNYKKCVCVYNIYIYI